MKKINFYWNKIKKMEHFENLTQIKGMYLGRNPITAIEGILHLSRLTDLSLGQTQITNIEPLKVFTKMKKLALDGLGLKKITEVFKNFDDLYKLNLSNN